MEWLQRECGFEFEVITCDLILCLAAYPAFRNLNCLWLVAHVNDNQETFLCVRLFKDQYIIISGEMVASLMGPSGRIIRVAAHQAGKLLAPAFLFASDNQYPVTVEATTEATILRLTLVDLEKMLNSDQRLMMNYIRMLSNTVCLLTKKVRMLSMSVREKVCLYLKEQSKQQQT